MRPIVHDIFKNWDFKIKLDDLFEEIRKEDTELWYDSMGREIAKRIRAAGFYGAYEDQTELENICSLFEEIDECADAQDFDIILHAFYNWADRGKRVWISTF